MSVIAIAMAIAMAIASAIALSSHACLCILSLVRALSLCLICMIQYVLWYEHTFMALRV